MTSHNKTFSALVFTWPLTAILIFFSTPSLSIECTATGSTLPQAVYQYNKQCTLPRKDCDVINGIWHCSSEQIKSTQTDSPLKPLPLPLPSRTLETGADLNPFLRLDDNPLVCVDPDDDGWGWNGVSSCKVSRSQNPTALVSNLGPDQTRTQPQPQPQTDSPAVCIDSDSDGWGWNGVESCKVAERPATSEEQIARSVYRGTSIVSQPSSVPENCDKLRSGNYHITELVTDVFLSAGQSNATGGNTRYSPESNKKDKVNNRVIVWTENNQWEIANPRTQTWHNHKYPGGYNVFNHPAFQIGRAMADQDECRVIAFIATAASGMPIDHWRHNRENHYTDIVNKVTNAINALPTRHSVDMIWWMQGEADNDEIVRRYTYKLNEVIAMFRSESWFQADGYFLANETGWSMYANEAIRLLREDGNIFTDYSRGEDSPSDSFPDTGESDSFKVHFNETALRKIGDLVAHKYLNDYLKNRSR